MTQIFNRSVQNLLNDLKEVMRSAMMESGRTQEDLADQTMTTQPTIHRWFSYDLNFFPPLYILSLLPEEIVVPICNFFLKRSGKIIIDLPDNLHTDGNLDDNILNIHVIVADIIKIRDKNPVKAIRICDRLIKEVLTLQKEAKEIVDKKSELSRA